MASEQIINASSGAYTPINWQTGDTITAEKMNKMDNGWGVQETQLFSETVMTENNRGTLVYGSQIDAPTLTVTFDGTDYTCNVNNINESYAYGGVGATGPDFTNYPFALASGPVGNIVYTETTGTHTIAVAASVLQTSAGFDKAVKSVVDVDAIPLKCVVGTTTRAEMVAAKSAGRLMYFASGGSYFIITGGVSNGTITFMPEQGGLVAEFDGNDLFSLIQY